MMAKLIWIFVGILELIHALLRQSRFKITSAWKIPLSLFTNLRVSYLGEEKVRDKNMDDNLKPRGLSKKLL